jgi:hypothetical protein
MRITYSCYEIELNDERAHGYFFSLCALVPYSPYRFEITEALKVIMHGICIFMTCMINF